MKRFVLLLTAAVMLLALSAAYAEGADASAPDPNLMDIYRVEGEDLVWFCTAIPVSEGVAVMPADLLPEDLSTIRISDGVTAWTPMTAAKDRSGVLAVLVYDADTAPQVIGKFELAPMGSSVTPGQLRVMAGDENSSRIIRTVLSGSALTWRNTSCMVLTLSGPAAPGSVLVTDEGRLAGMAVAEYAEGTNRVVFVSVDGLYNGMLQSLDVLTSEDSAGAPQGFTYTEKNGLVTFDWSAMQLPQPGAGEDLYLVVADQDNDYLTYWKLLPDYTTYQMVLTPGRAYTAGIMAYREAPGSLPRERLSFRMPEAGKLDKYNFESKVCAFAEGPAGGLKAGELPEPVTEVTEELLRSGRAYYYSSTTYEVTGSIYDIPLLVSMTDPNGVNYRYESTWMYDMLYQKNDTWAVSLDDAGLLEMLNANGYPKGTYVVTMYIGGEYADSFTFELK